MRCSVINFWLVIAIIFSVIFLGSIFALNDDKASNYMTIINDIACIDSLQDEIRSIKKPIIPVVVISDSMGFVVW
jgi:hypothetical protein